MEEQKLNKEGMQESPKYTESQLNAACQRIYQDASKRIQQLEMVNMFKRLDYLFKVMELKECFSKDFVCKCKEEIEVAMSVPEEQKDSEDKESK